MSNLFQWPIRVYYEDTDAGGVVYHARYVAFYERARTEMLRYYNISQQQLLRDEQLAFAVRSMNIEYIAPARLDDLLEVKTQLTNIRKASITFTQHITDQNGKLLSTADVLIACINPHKAKPVALPQSIISEFSQWLK